MSAARVLPISELGLTERDARAARVLSGLLVLAVAGTFAILAVDPGGDGSNTAVEQTAVCVATALAALNVWARTRAAPRNRRAWVLLAVGVTAYATGFVLLALGVPEPVPDVFWLALYPAVSVCGALVIRSWSREFTSHAWLDGVIAGCGAAALAAALFLPSLADLRSSASTTALGYIYPLADLLVVVAIMVGAATATWRPGRGWTFAATGLLLLLAGDLAHVRALTSGEIDAPVGSTSSALWVLGLGTLALSAWQAHPDIRLEPEGWVRWRAMAVPVGFSVISLGVLILLGVGASPVPVVLAAISSVAAMVRTLLSFRELRTLAESNRLALTDDLTGLPNRRALYAMLEEQLAVARRTRAPLSLLVVDVEDFRVVNEALGAPAGDEVLRQLGARLAAAAPEDAVVGRLGADEFAVVLPAVARDGAKALGGALVKVAAAPMSVADVTLEIDVRIGVAAHPQDGDDAVTLMRRAATALDQAGASPSRVATFEVAADPGGRERLIALTELRRALATGQIVAYFQPQADPATGAVEGMEALARWEHPQRGLVPPGLFLPLVIQAGLMRVLTERMLELTLAQAARWRAEGLELGVSVNVAAPNLLDLEFPAFVARVLAESGVPPEGLTLEITEDVVMAESEGAIENIERLRALGVRLSLDDFGTGHSSLAKLKRLPIQELKIDRSFVFGLTEDPADRAIVETTVRLARSFELCVVAEGVENDASWMTCAHLGCDAIQGYRLSRPAPPEEISAWLGNGRTVPPDLRRPAAGAGAARRRAAP